MLLTVTLRVWLFVLHRLSGENELMASLGARYVLSPRKNPFAAVTTLHPPGQKALWYSANAFVYAVQGTVEPAGMVEQPAETTRAAVAAPLQAIEVNECDLYLPD